MSDAEKGGAMAVFLAILAVLLILSHGTPVESFLIGVIAFALVANGVRSLFRVLF